MARDFRTRLARRASKSGVFLDEALASGLVVYYELLARWNRKINLTSLEDPDEAIDRLLLEPVVAARHLSPAVVDVMDIGSGGGSPALPLALALGPQVRLTMVEVKARKSAFLREAVRHLGLTDARVETSRYEELLALPELHERFDVLSMRAVKVESRVLMTLQAFVRPGGELFLFRASGGADPPEAITPPLAWKATYPLIESLRSRLVVLEKRSIGRAVPRGT